MIININYYYFYYYFIIFIIVISKDGTRFTRTILVHPKIHDGNVDDGTLL